MVIAGVILAAGRGRRMGGPKGLLEVHGVTFVERAVATFQLAGASPIVAVLGHEAERMEALLRPAGAASCVRNARPDEGMLSSILLGLEAAETAEADAVLLHPVDHPLVSPDTVTRVMEALRTGAVIAVPSHGGRRGHPGGFARGSWAALRRAPPDRGARAVLADHPEWVVHVAGDPGCLAGIDTPQDYERLIGPRS